MAAIPQKKRKLQQDGFQRLHRFGHNSLASQPKPDLVTEFSCSYCSETVAAVVIADQDSGRSCPPDQILAGLTPLCSVCRTRSSSTASWCRCGRPTFGQVVFMRGFFLNSCDPLVLSLWEMCKSVCINADQELRSNRGQMGTKRR